MFPTCPYQIQMVNTDSHLHVQPEYKLMSLHFSLTAVARTQVKRLAGEDENNFSFTSDDGLH